jgi:hypothetical protein
MSEISNTEEIRKIPSPENKKVTFFGNYEITNVLIIVFYDYSSCWYNCW